MIGAGTRNYPSSSRLQFRPLPIGPPVLLQRRHQSGQLHRKNAGRRLRPRYPLPTRLDAPQRLSQLRRCQRGVDSCGPSRRRRPRRDDLGRPPRRRRRLPAERRFEQLGPPAVHLRLWWVPLHRLRPGRLPRRGHLAVIGFTFAGGYANVPDFPGLSILRNHSRSQDTLLPSSAT